MIGGLDRRARALLVGGTIATIALSLLLWRGIPGMGIQSSELRSSPSGPGGPPPRPSFLAGPLTHANPAVQTAYFTDRVAGIRLWLEPAPGFDAGRGLIELRRGPDGPSLRSGTVAVRSGSPSVLLALSPPLAAWEAPGGSPVYLLVSAAPDSPPIYAGVIQGDGYPEGKLFMAGVEAGRQDDLHFAAILRLRPYSDLPALLVALGRSTSPKIWALALSAPTFAALLAAAVLKARPKTLAFLLVLTGTLAMAAIFALDGLDVGFFPGAGLPVSGYLR